MLDPCQFHAHCRVLRWVVVRTSAVPLAARYMKTNYLFTWNSLVLVCSCPLVLNPPGEDTLRGQAVRNDNEDCA